MHCIVFIPLALNQSLFYLEIAKCLKAQGVESVFVSFHEQSLPLIAESGFKVYSPFSYSSTFNAADEEGLADIAARYGVNPNRLIAHEKSTYEIADSAVLFSKFVNHAKALSLIFDEIESVHDDFIIVQELGGFLSVLAVYFEARFRGIDNFFIEPSFFRARLFFVKNSLESYSVKNSSSGQPTDEVLNYLDETIKSGLIVVPKKDAMAYRGVLKKVFNRHNFSRFFSKLYTKYFLGQSEEFSHIFVYIKKHLRMIVNRYLLARKYTSLPEDPFFYYPFHVPDDVALTLRAPEYYDQCALADYIARTIPAGTLLCLKEHPARVGALDRSRMCQLLKKNDNIRLLDSAINNYKVFDACLGVVTVNSKSGAEAAAVGKPVACLGDAFYRESPIVTTIDKLSELELFFTAVVSGDNCGQDMDDIHRYFEAVWESSYPGELYDLDPDNLKIFTKSLLESVSRQ